MSPSPLALAVGYLVFFGLCGMLLALCWWLLRRILLAVLLIAAGHRAIQAARRTGHTHYSPAPSRYRSVLGWLL